MSKQLQEVFENFVSFGSSRNLSTGEDSLSNGQALMDNARFAKFCRDTKVIDGKKVTSTDVDIVFNKVKAKGARKLDFAAFQRALEELAVVKYKGKSQGEAFGALVDHVLRHDTPIAKATVPQTGGIFEKLLYDQSTFPATHKNRFNEDGTGRGKEGRTEQGDTLVVGLNSVVNRSTNGVLNGNSSRRGSTSSLNDSGSGSGSKKVAIESAAPAKASSQGSYAAAPSKASGKNSSPRGSGNIFDRLTDSTQYTGSHKHRFNADGTGRGIAGRDSVPLGHNPGKYRGGDVKDLSQILRN